MRFIGWPGFDFGAELSGAPHTVRGLVMAMGGVVEVNEKPGAEAVSLRWTHEKHAGSALEYGNLVHIEGDFYNEARGVERSVAHGLKPNIPYSIDVFPASPGELDYIGQHGFFWRGERGNRVILSWIKVDLATAGNDDFDAYEIYWDNSRGDGNADTLLTTVRGVGNLTYVTDALPDGDYTFALKYRDILGNRSSFGTDSTITVDSFPVAVASQGLSYDSPTRRVTLTGTVPAGQSADVVGYAVYWNHVTGFGLQDRLAMERWLRIGWIQPSGSALSWVSPDLFAGHWEFCIKAVDKAGNESTYAVSTVDLGLDGSNLIEFPLRPARPYWIDAEPLAGGLIRVKVRLDVTDATHVVVEQDNVEVNVQAVVAGQSEYSYTTGALTDGVEYSFRARGRNTVGGNTMDGLLSDAVTATADSNAPTGDGLLVAGLVF